MADGDGLPVKGRQEHHESQGPAAVPSNQGHTYQRRRLADRGIRATAGPRPWCVRRHREAGAMSPWTQMVIAVVIDIVLIVGLGVAIVRKDRQRRSEERR